MMNKFVSLSVSAALLVAGLMISTASAQEINYNLPSADTIQKQKDSRRNQAVGDRVGRRIMRAFELYSEEEDIVAAIAELEEADPRETFDKAYLNRFLGNLYAAQDRMEDAFRSIKIAADADILGWSDHASSLKLAGDLALGMEKYSEALNYYGKWLQFTGEYDPQVLMRVANAYYELKQYDKIIRPADLAIQYAEEPDKNPYVLKVASYYERKMYAQAIEVLEAGLLVLPGERTWWNQLGMLYLLEERVDKALQTLELAYLAGYFDKESQYKALVQLYANNDIPFKAAETMVKHLASGDIEKTARNYQNAASNFEASKEFAKAARYFGEAAKLEEEDDDRAMQYRRQGTSFIRAERYRDAEQAYLKALEFGIEDKGAVYMSLAETYFYQEKYADALRYVLEAKRLPDTRRAASSWEQYIRTKASNKGVNL